MKTWNVGVKSDRNPLWTATDELEETPRGMSHPGTGANSIGYSPRNGHSSTPALPQAYSDAGLGPPTKPSVATAPAFPGYPPALPPAYPSYPPVPSPPKPGSVVTGLGLFSMPPPPIKYPSGRENHLDSAPKGVSSIATAGYLGSIPLPKIPPAASQSLSATTSPSSHSLRGATVATPSPGISRALSTSTGVLSTPSPVPHHPVVAQSWQPVAQSGPSTNPPFFNGQASALSAYSGSAVQPPQVGSGASTYSAYYNGQGATPSGYGGSVPTPPSGLPASTYSAYYSGQAATPSGYGGSVPTPPTGLPASTYSAYYNGQAATPSGYGGSVPTPPTGLPASTYSAYYNGQAATPSGYGGSVPTPPTGLPASTYSAYYNGQAATPSGYGGSVPIPPSGLPASTYSAYYDGQGQPTPSGYGAPWPPLPGMYSGSQIQGSHLPTPPPQRQSATTKNPAPSSPPPPPPGTSPTPDSPPPSSTLVKSFVGKHKFGIKDGPKRSFASLATSDEPPDKKRLVDEGSLNYPSSSLGEAKKASVCAVEPVKYRTSRRHSGDYPPLEVYIDDSEVANLDPILTDERFNFWNLPSQSTVLLVSSLPLDIAKPDPMFHLFGFYGDVVRVKVFENRLNVGIVQFRTASQAMIARNYLDGLIIHGADLVVSFSRYGTVPLEKDPDSQSDEVWVRNYDTPQYEKYFRFSSDELRKTNLRRIMKPGSKVYLSNVPYKTSGDDIKAIIAGYGLYVKEMMVIIQARKTKKESLKMVYIEFPEPGTAAMAFALIAGQYADKNSIGLQASFTSKSIAEERDRIFAQTGTELQIVPLYHKG